MVSDNIYLRNCIKLNGATLGLGAVVITTVCALVLKKLFL